MEPVQFHTEKIRAIAQLAELSQDITWVTDLPSGNIIYANRAVMAMHGLAPDAWLKADPAERQGLIHPGDRALIDEYYSLFAGVINDSEVKTVEFRAVTASGKWLPLSVKGRVFDRHPDGSVRAVLSMAQNITGQEQAAQEINEHRDLLQKIMDAPNVGMGVFKAVRDEAGDIQDFRFEFVNRRTLEAFQGNDPVGRLLTDYGSDGIEQLQFFKDVIHTGKVNSYTRKAEAGIVEGWFLFSNAPLGDDRLVQVWEDITEIKKTEQEMQEQAHFIASVNNMIPDVVAVVELPSRNILYTNRDVMTWADFDTAEIAGMSFQDRISLFHPEDLPAIQAFYKRFESLKDDEQNTLEYRLKNKKGGWITLSLRGRVFKRDAAGNAIQVIFTAHDITERRRSEQEIMRLKDEITQRATEKYRNLFNSMTEGLTICEMIYNEHHEAIDWRWLEVNPAFEQQVDIKADLLIGRRRTEVFSAVDEELLEKYTRALETQQPVEFEAHSKVSGKWLYIRAMPFGHRQFAVLFENIDERKKAEEALRQSEEKFRILFNSMDEGYCIIQMLYDNEGKACDWLYLEVNPAFERHNGLEHAAGKTIRELAPDIEEKWMEIYDRVAKTGESVRFEESSAALNRVFDLYAFRIGQPEDRRVAVLFADISRRKKSEQALHEREAWINGQKEAFQAAINGEPLAVSLDALVRMVTQQFNGEASVAFYMSSAGGAGLKLVAGTAGLHTHDVNGFASGAGSLACSLAMQSGEPVVIPDIETDPLWETWRHMASESGYHGCWSFPVLIKEGSSIGTFAMYFKQPRQPRPADLGLAGVVTHAASIIISSDVQLMKRSQAEEALKELNLDLEQRVEKRTQEIISLKMRQEKEKLNAVIFVQEQERTRIGEGLHNGVAQLLYAVQSRLQLVRSNGDDDDKNLKASMQIISEAIHDTRRISFELMPPVLKDFGLAIALGTLMARVFSDKIKLKMNVGLKKRLSEDLEVSIYRIVQEAINNILKHAEATEAAVEIVESRDAVKIKIADNGKGFAPRKVRKQQKGIGLQTIENRVKLLNGSLKFRSKPGEGTSLEIRLPLGSGRL